MLLEFILLARVVKLGVYGVALFARACTLLHTNALLKQHTIKIIIWMNVVEQCV